MSQDGLNILGLQTKSQIMQGIYKLQPKHSNNIRWLQFDYVIHSLYIKKFAYLQNMSWERMRILRRSQAKHRNMEMPWQEHMWWLSKNACGQLLAIRNDNLNQTNTILCAIDHSPTYIQRTISRRKDVGLSLNVLTSTDSVISNTGIAYS